jgi:hypothetical protein
MARESAPANERSGTRNGCDALNHHCSTTRARKYARAPKRRSAVIAVHHHRHRWAEDAATHSLHSLRWRHCDDDTPPRPPDLQDGCVCHDC